MNKEQIKVFELIKEFDVFCKENKIKYCLSGDTLMYGVAKGSISPRPYGGFVIMTGENCRRFIDAFQTKKPDNRELEYWGNSPAYPNYSVRYIASDTTSFSVMECLNYQCHGLFVEIQILRGENKKKETVRKIALERGMALNAYSTKTKTAKIRRKKDILADKYYQSVSTIKGKKKIRKDLFDYFSKECNKPASQGRGISGVYTFFHKSKKIKDVSENYFNKPGTCEIEGYVFPIPRNSGSFLRKVYGKNFFYSTNGAVIKDNFAYVNNCIIDVDTPYKEAMKKLNISKQDLIEIQKKQERIDEINRENKNNNAIANADWQSVLQTGARFRMWKKYMPLKAEIIKLHKEGNYTVLLDIFRDYTEELADMEGQNRSFAFDNDLFDIYISTLEHRGRFNEADRAIRLLPKSHLNEIELKIEDVKKNE